MKDARLLLIYPPQTRNTEPPIGISLLAGVLQEHGIGVSMLDLNRITAPSFAATIEDSEDTLTHRVFKNIQRSIVHLQTKSGYTSYSKYVTFTNYYAKALQLSCKPFSWKVTPSDYTDRQFTSYEATCFDSLYPEAHENPFFAHMRTTIQKQLEISSPAYIGFSVIFRSQFLPAMYLASWLKQYFPGIEILFGGSFMKILPEDLQEYIAGRFGKLILHNEAETLIRIFRKALHISGTHFFLPDYTSVDFSTYFSPVPVIPILSSMGCYWGKCAFCDEGKIPFRKITPVELRSHLRRLARQNPSCIFHFTDNAIPPDILKHLAQSGCPAPWYGFSRMIPQLKNRDFTRALRESGCLMLQLGLESPVQTILDHMNKGVSTCDYGKILENLRESGIKTFGYFLFGLPGQSFRDYEQTIRFLNDYPVDFINASIFRVPKLSPISETPRDFGINMATRASAHRIYHDFTSGSFTHKELRIWMSKVFYRDRVVRTLKYQTPSFYKSNHAVFFNPSSTLPDEAKG